MSGTGVSAYYALEIAHMEQQLAQEEARYKALLQEQLSLSDDTRPSASERTNLHASANRTMRSSFIPNSQTDGR